MLLFYFMMVLFKLMSVYLTGLIIGGTILGMFPINEIFTLILPLIMLGLGIGFEKLFGFEDPKFLNTKLKKTIVYSALFIFGFFCVL